MGNFISRTFDALTGRTGARAAGEAGRLQAQAIREGSRIEQAGFEEAMATLMEQLGVTREQFSGAQTQFDPFREAGVDALGEVRRGSTAGGLESIISEIMGGEAFGGLVEERQRGIQGQLAAGGLTRSGAAIEEAARIPTDLAFQIENLLAGRQRDIAGTGLSAAGTSAQLTAQEQGATGSLVQSIIQSITGGAAAEARGVTGAAGATASGILGGAQAEAQGMQNLLNLGGVLGAAAIKSSDPRLKENVRHIGSVGELDLVEWDWIPELGDDFFKDAPTMGFMSTQVKELYPEYVHELGGYDAIDYVGLRNRLNEEGKQWRQ